MSTIDGLRIVTLDNLIPGKWYGQIGPEQLRWLGQVLADDAASTTVTAMHHPPIDVGVEIQQRVRLADSEDLAAVVGRGAVSAILCGHFHQQIACELGGVPTWVTPGVFIDHLTGPKGTERALAGGAASLVELTAYGPRPAVFNAADPNAGQLAYETTLPEIAAELSAFGIPQTGQRCPT